MNKTIVITIILIVFAGSLFWGFQTGFFSGIKPEPITPTPLPEGIVLFYGDGCPHCKTVDDFISQNKINEKVQFTKLEVWYNEQNQLLLGQTAQKCGIALDQVGVPFLYDGEKCLIGAPDIIDFFKNEAGVK